MPTFKERFGEEPRELMTALTRSAITLTGSVADAEDLVQETMVRLLKSTTTEYTNARGYAYVILRNLARKRWSGAKAEQSFAPDALPEEPDADADTEERAIAQLEPLDLDGRVFALLTQRQAEVVALRFSPDGEFMPYSQVAQILGCSPDAARQHWSEAMKRLRSEWLARGWNVQ